ncbi:MAG: hypothetical protein IIC55_07955 [Proteobacteria bacterium]|nr:hypothetical protein [Pseudomonadota bacterium]
MNAVLRMTVSKKGAGGRISMAGSEFAWNESERNPGPNIVNLLTAEAIRLRVAADDVDGEIHYDVFITEA